MKEFKMKNYCRSISNKELFDLISESCDVDGYTTDYDFLELREKNSYLTIERLVFECVEEDDLINFINNKFIDNYFFIHSVHRIYGNSPCIILNYFILETTYDLIHYKDRKIEKIRNKRLKQIINDL